MSMVDRYKCVCMVNKKMVNLSKLVNNVCEKFIKLYFDDDFFVVIILF